MTAIIIIIVYGSRARPDNNIVREVGAVLLYTSAKYGRRHLYYSPHLFYSIFFFFFLLAYDPAGLRRANRNSRILKYANAYNTGPRGEP